MSIQVARRVVKEPGRADRILRASLVSCDFPLCDKALEFPVNLQSSDHQCKRDTIRYLDVKHPHGWHTAERGSLFFCRTHSEIKGIK